VFMISCAQIRRHREGAATKSRHLTGTGRFVFSATVSASMRDAVETLFFFNPRQALLRSAIDETVRRTGVPEIFEYDGAVWIGVPERAMQCLFVCTLSQTARHPVAVALYERPTLDVLAIPHLAVNPLYASWGNNRGAGLGVFLVRKILEIAHCIKGVTRVQMPYREACFLRVGSGT
jgi:hypothetical protein